MSLWFNNLASLWIASMSVNLREETDLMLLVNLFFHGYTPFRSPTKPSLNVYFQSIPSLLPLTSHIILKIKNIHQFQSTYKVKSIFINRA